METINWLTKIKNKLRVNENPVHELKLAKEGDSGYDIYPNIPTSDNEWDAAIAFAFVVQND